MLSRILLLAVAATAVAAQQPAYAQCGGQSWTGSTKCVTGYSCTYSNAWYSQCLPSTTGTPVWSSRIQLIVLTMIGTTKANPSPSPSPTTAKSTPTSGSSGSSGSGKTYKASFTQYGSTDTWGKYMRIRSYSQDRQNLCCSCTGDHPLSIVIYRGSHANCTYSRQRKLQYQDYRLRILHLPRLLGCCLSERIRCWAGMCYTLL